MILVIDVGNTNIIFGVYNNRDLIATWKMTTISSKTADEIGIFIISLFSYNNINYKNIKGVVISSVVPDIMYSLKRGINKYFNLEPMIVGPGIKTGINIKADDPKEVGSNLLVNAVAARELYGGNIIIVDYDTATKFNIVLENNEFLGCVICPGIGICADALYQSAAQLPKVEIKKPNVSLGKNTVECVQLGLIYSALGQTEYILKVIRNEYSKLKFKVVATGGMGLTIFKYTNCIDEYNANLTLDGLRIIYEKNK